jgi:hypothetical protein
MTWGIPTGLFLQIHVVLSLIGIASGLIAMYGVLRGKLSAGWTALFLATTIATSITGFPLPPFGFDPPRAIGVISLVLLSLAVAALYLLHLAGAWRWVFIVSAFASLYLNVAVGIIQGFQKLAFLHPLAPTQSEPPFLIAQLAVLLAFIAAAVLALIRFPPRVAARA